MSNLKIEELFTVDASVETVWKFLLDPAEVATCLPGAKLDGLVEGESDTYRGTMKVKVGPVVSEFRGKATLSDVNEAKHSLKISGTGDDKGGGGSARMTMTCRVQPALDVPEGATQCEVAVIAEVELAGKLVRFGRGMIEGVSKQMFKHFVSRARAKLTGSSLPGGSSSQDIPSIPHDRASTGDSAPMTLDRGPSGSVTVSPELLAAAAEVLPAPSGPHEIGPGRPEIAPSPPKIAPASDEIAPSPPKIAPASGEVIPASDEIAPAPPKIAPASDEIAPASAEIAPGPTKTAPASAEIAPGPTKTAPASDQIAPAAPQTAPAAPKIEPAKADSGPAKALQAADAAPKSSGRSAALPARPSDITTAIIPRPKLRPEANLPQKAATAAGKLTKEDDTLDAGALIWTVLWDWFKGLFRRLFGRGEKGAAGKGS